ncbi:MAG: HAMP domain-containing histidine kinase [Candidatus Melainabacteria bacterium]|nr:HAMP domain-containing histidine kinase [Candidatus Melainabacteria bacterium]
MSENSTNKLTQGELRLKMAIDMAHELRTPLGGIVGMNELLLTSELDSDQKQFSETIHDSAKSMLQLLTDFVELARLDAGKLAPNPASFHLQTLLDECSFGLRKVLKSNNVQMQVSVDANIPDKITTDEDFLRNAIIAIVSGALKYVESGTISIYATQSKERKSTSFTITLPPNTVNRNGQPLFTNMANDNAPVLRYDSTWLRLSIAQRLLKLMNASISVSGNTLEFNIPS